MFSRFGKPAGVTLLRIGAEHGDACAAVHADCFTYAWPAHDLDILLTSPSTYANGALTGQGDLVGFILSRVAADEAEILTIAVAPRRRGTGIARKLMHANMAQLQIAGARSWFLEVEAQNTIAIALYRSMQFEKVGERKSYYRAKDGEAATAFILRRKLL